MLASSLDSTCDFMIPPKAQRISSSIISKLHGISDDSLLNKSIWQRNLKDGTLSV